MKACEFTKALSSAAKLVASSRTRDALRYLSSGLSQLEPSKAALSALSDLKSGLDSSVDGGRSEAQFSDLLAFYEFSETLLASAGTKQAKESIAVLRSIIVEHGNRSAQLSEEILALSRAGFPGGKPRRTGKPKAVRPANPEVVARYVEAFHKNGPGSHEYAVALNTLEADKSAKEPEVIAVANALGFRKSSKKAAREALKAPHEIALAAQAKFKSGANAA